MHISNTNVILIQGVTVRAVKSGETREVVVEHGRNVGYINREDGSRVCEIPEEFEPPDRVWPCHVAGLDRGSVGTGGQNFMENDERVEAFTYSSYDKFHGHIRDQKNALNANKTCSEVCFAIVVRLGA